MLIEEKENYERHPPTFVVARNSLTALEDNYNRKSIHPASANPRKNKNRATILVNHETTINSVN